MWARDSMGESTDTTEWSSLPKKLLHCISFNANCCLNAARANVDYSAPSVRRDFPPGSGNGAEICMDITIIDDTWIEGTEYFHVFQDLQTHGVGVREGTNHRVATIIDNDCA